MIACSDPYRVLTKGVASGSFLDDSSDSASLDSEDPEHMKVGRSLQMVTDNRCTCFRAEQHLIQLCGVGGVM